MFFNSWHALWRMLVVFALAYPALLLLLRISGKRTLAKMNAFDFVVTIAMGSTLATVILSRQVALVEGVLAFALLIFTQYAVAWLSVRSPGFRKLIRSQPRLLYFRGQMLDEAMRLERVTRGEVLAAIREKGVASLDDVEAVVLETAGTFTVLRKARDEGPRALMNVQGYPEAGDDR